MLAESGHEWIGKAAAEGLAAELQKSGNLKTTSDANAAADWTVSGSIQIVEGQMKVSAQLVHPADGTTKSITTTGNVRDLFEIENSMAERAAKNRFASGRPNQPARWPPPRRLKFSPPTVCINRNILKGTSRQRWRCRIDSPIAEHARTIGRQTGI